MSENHWTLGSVAGTVDKYHAPEHPNARPDREHPEITDPDERAAHPECQPDEVAFIDGNLLCNAGIQRMLDQLTGATSTPFNNANTRLGVGDSATAATAADVDLGALAGTTHRQFKVMNATYPSRSGQTLTFQATFATTEANFAWAEWCIDNGNATGTTVVAPMLNHKIVALGTKVNTSSWVLTVTVTES